MRISTSALVFLLLLLPGVILAQTTNQSLINLPINNQAGESGFSSYINLLYALSISAAGLLAVIKIIIAGVKYMLTDVVTSKGDAIREIKGALLGLLLILGAVLILTVINPRLASTSLQFDPQPVPPRTPAQPSVTTNPSGGTTNTQSTNTTTNSQTSGTNNQTSGTNQTNTTASQFDPSCIKGTRTTTQGTVTYQYFDLKSCGFANMATARTYLYQNICKPNAVLNGGNDTYYCKQ